MNELTPYIGFLSVSLLIAISPGPSWVYTISTTLSRGRRAGMIGNLGNSSGILCHAITAALGLSLIIEYSTSAFYILKALGVIYLLYLAFISFKNGSPINVNRNQPERSDWLIFRNGAFASIFNPKITLLMVALLPQFISPESSNAKMQIFILGSMHAVTAAIVHTHVVFFSGIIAKKISSSNRFQRFTRWLTGGFFLAFSLKLAFEKQG